MKGWGTLKGKAMASHRKITPGGSAAAGNTATGCLSEEEQSTRDKTTKDGVQPSAGRNGKVGARAERPADSRAATGKHSAEPARTGNGPSPAASSGDGRDEHALQPMRDTTG